MRKLPAPLLILSVRRTVRPLAKNTDHVKNAETYQARAMRIRSLLPFGQWFIAVSMITGCSHEMQVQKTLFSRCEQQVQARLNDPESYKRRSEVESVRQIEGQPKVIGWTFNAKNSLGGYSSPVEALCYETTDGNVSTFVGNGSTETEDMRRRQDYLALTNPELAARLQAIESQYQNKVAETCEPLREQYQKNGYVGECTKYFLEGSMPR